MSSPAQPEGSIYPRAYPEGSALVSGPTARSFAPPTPTTGPDFTRSGAYIDPVVRLPELDPYADRESAGANTPAGALNAAGGVPTQTKPGTGYGEGEEGQ